MRISDWSSDVCSSDLSGVDRGLVEARRIGLDELEPVFGVLAHQSVDQVLDQMALFIFLRQGYAEHRARRRVHRRFLQLVDRKSVESGQRVSVRVERGGRRITKKKTRQQYKHNT